MTIDYLIKQLSEQPIGREVVVYADGQEYHDIRPLILHSHLVLKLNDKSGNLTCNDLYNFAMELYRLEGGDVKILNNKNLQPVWDISESFIETADGDEEDILKISC